jgi:hypothetical protein
MATLPSGLLKVTLGIATRYHGRASRDGLNLEASTGQRLIMMSNATHSTPEAVDITQLHEGQVVTVGTRNSTYRLTIRDSAHRLASIEGGQFFAQPVIGSIEGTPFEDGPVRTGIIQPGRRLEIIADNQRIVTSTIRSLDVAA